MDVLSVGPQVRDRGPPTDCSNPADTSSRLSYGAPRTCTTSALSRSQPLTVRATQSSGLTEQTLHDPSVFEATRSVELPRLDMQFGFTIPHWNLPESLFSFNTIPFCFHYLFWEKVLFLINYFSYIKY